MTGHDSVKKVTRASPGSGVVPRVIDDPQQEATTAMLRTAAVFFLSVGLVACVGSKDGAAPGSGVSYDQIDVTELSDSVGDMNAFQLVRTYKPEWIANRRGQARYSRARVYLNRSRTPLGDISSLKFFSASRIRTIERLSAVESQHRLGDGNPDGAIVVRTRGGNSRSE